MGLGAWHGEERARRESKAAVEAWARRVEKLSMQEVARGTALSGGSSAALPAVRESREADRRKEKWT